MPKTVRVAVLVGPSQIEVHHAPVPEPGPHEVLVRVRAVGVCGSDIHQFNGHLKRGTSYPLVLGHEFSGEVAAVGPGVEGVRPGSRVACAPDRPCGVCEWCRKGETNVCPNVVFAASGGVPGCLAEYYVLHTSQLHPLADSISFEHAVLFEPLANGLHLVENLVRPAGGESYAIIGAGAYGLSVLVAARLNGASAAYVSDLVPERMDAARSLGADGVFDARGGVFADFILDHTRGRGVDVVVECAGDVSAMEQTVHLAAIHGTVVIAGIPPVETFRADLAAMRPRELTLIAARRSVGKSDRALDLIASAKFDARRLKLVLFPLERCQQAFEEARDRRGGLIRAVVTP